MPLVTRTATAANVYSQAASPTIIQDGEVWVDTDTGILYTSENGSWVQQTAGAFGSASQVLKMNSGATALEWGSSSFSAAAVVSHSTTLTDYTVPSAAIMSSSNPSVVSIVDNDTNGNTQPLYTGFYTRYAVTFTASSAYLGRPVTKCSFWLKKTLSPTGTITVNIRDSGDTIRETVATYDSAALTTDFAWVDFTSALGTTVLASGDRLSLEYGGGDASNHVNTGFNTSSIYDTTATYTARYNGSYAAETAYDLSLRLYTDTAFRVYDTNTATKAITASGNNPYIYVDMGSAVNICAIAMYWDGAATTETEIKIQTSADATTWTDRRKITTSNLSDSAWNYYRFNIAGGARYVRVYGTGTSKVLSIWEIKVLKKTDAEIFNDLGIVAISSSDTSLDSDGV